MRKFSKPPSNYGLLQLIPLIQYSWVINVRMLKILSIWFSQMFLSMDLLSVLTDQLQDDFTKSILNIRFFRIVINASEKYT